MAKQEKLLVLHGDRKGPFRRTVDGEMIVFERKVPVSVTEAQFEFLKPDLGAALLLAKKVKRKGDDKTDEVLVYDWEATKKQCLEDAEKLSAEGKGLSRYQAVCLHEKELIMEQEGSSEGPDIEELAEGLGVTVEVAEVMSSLEGFPPAVGGKWPLSEIDAWMQTKEVAENLNKTLNEKKPVEDGDEKDEIELTTQQQLADFFEVELDVVKKWVKAGLKKSGKAYDLEVVGQFIEENDLIGDISKE